MTISDVPPTKNQLVLTFDNKQNKKFVQWGFCPPPPASFPTFHSMNFHGMVTSSNFIGLGTSPFPLISRLWQCTVQYTFLHYTILKPGCVPIYVFAINEFLMRTPLVICVS